MDKCPKLLKCFIFWSLGSKTSFPLWYPHISSHEKINPKYLVKLQITLVTLKKKYFTCEYAYLEFQPSILTEWNDVVMFLILIFLSRYFSTLLLHVQDKHFNTAILQIQYMTPWIYWIKTKQSPRCSQHTFNTTAVRMLSGLEPEVHCMPTASPRQVARNLGKPSKCHF